MNQHVLDCNQIKVLIMWPLVGWCIRRYSGWSAKCDLVVLGYSLTMLIAAQWMLIAAQWRMEQHSLRTAESLIICSNRR